MLLAISHAALSSPVASLNTIYLLVVILTTLLGTGVITGAVTAWRALRKKVLEKNTIDAAVAAVPALEAKLAEMKAESADQFEELRRLITPNGLKTNDPGNILARVETAVKEQGQTLERHIGYCNAEHKELRRDIGRVTDDVRAVESSLGRKADK